MLNKRRLPSRGKVLCNFMRGRISDQDIQYHELLLWNHIQVAYRHNFFPRRIWRFHNFMPVSSMKLSASFTFEIEKLGNIQTVSVFRQVHVKHNYKKYKIREVSAQTSFQAIKSHVGDLFHDRLQDFLVTCVRLSKSYFILRPQ